jgi:hypothetical protein
MTIYVAVFNPQIAGRAEAVRHYGDNDPLPDGAVVVSNWTTLEPASSESLEMRVADGALYWHDPRTLDELRAARWATIKAQREALDNTPIALRDFEIDADASSRFDVMGALMAMQLTLATTRLWRCTDNVMRELTLTDLVAVGTGIASRRQGLIETSDALWQQLLAATTAAQIDAINWPT